MTFEVVFFLVAAFVLATALVVVLARNIVHAAVALIFCFGGVAAVYVLLDAEFLAAVQVLIYVGGITVLLLFAIMLTSRISGRTDVFNEQIGIAALITVGILAVVVYAVAKGLQGPLPPPAVIETTARIGRLLLTTYVLPFELVGLLLLAALIGALVLARRESE